MGVFSSIFSNSRGKSRKGKIVSGRNPGRGWNEANRFNQTKGGVSGGYGAITFGNIINADSDASEIVDEFDLDKENNQYCDAYLSAYSECYAEAEVKYQELCDYYYMIIKGLTAQMNEYLSTAKQLRQEAQELQVEAQGLRDDVEWCDDPEEMFDLLVKAEALEAEAAELIAEAEMLEAEAVSLQGEIDEYYSTVDMLTVEQFIDEDLLEQKAYEYALEVAESWIAGAEWIPDDVLNWAYYDVSDHNG